MLSFAKKLFPLLVLVVVASPAAAAVVLNGDPSLTSVEVNSPGCQCENATGHDPFDPRQTLCQLVGTVDVNVTSVPARVRFEYSIFGNALGAKHDGAGAWIELSASDGLNSPFVAMAALPPNAVRSPPDPNQRYGTTNIQSGETVDFVTPVRLTAQVWVAYNIRGGAGEEWGCPAPKTHRPSWMKIVVEPSP